MPPSEQQQQNSQPANPNNVWISREEYERLRAQTGQAQQSPAIIQPYTDTNSKTAADNDRHQWQIILGVLLAGGLYFSVVSGSFASLIVVGAIIIFAAVSIYDFYRSRQGGMAASKHNPYKILAITLACIVVAPPFLFAGFLILMLTLGGGDMGS